MLRRSSRSLRTGRFFPSIKMHDRLPRTLVVEDDDASRTALVRLLQHDGHFVESASTVADALQRLKNRPDVVLLDLHLPDGSGAQVLEQIRAKQMQAKVCLLTGSSTIESLAELNHLRADEIMLKPVNPKRVALW